MQRSFEPWIFGFPVDVDVWPGLYPWPSTVRLIVVYPLFIAGYVTMQKKTPFLSRRWSSCLHVTRRRLKPLDFNSYGTQCPSFWNISYAVKRFENVVWLTPNDSASSDFAWHESSWNNASNSLFSNFFGALERSLSLTSKSLFLKRLNQSLHVVSDRVWSP